MKSLPLYELQEIIELYNTGNSTTFLSHKYNIPIRRLGYWLKNRPEVNWRSKRKIPLNETFFETIDSGIKAYIIGFICADGYVCERKGFESVQIELNEKDISILEYIKNNLQYNRKITLNKKKKSCRLRITSKKIVKDLVNLGIKQCKSLNLKFPNVPQKYIWDFIRGYFDGDGCISVYKRSYYGVISNVIRKQIAIIGSPSFIETMSNIFNKFELPNSITKQGKMLILRIDNQKACMKFGELLYNENFGLIRKKEKFNDK